MTQKVRVRFAPSPTGFFHIGSARTVLFNWLYARHTGGTFVLRIEDTDHERNTDEALRVLLEGMQWLGLDWDEGPQKGGMYEPYYQSQRDDIYKTYLQKLRDNGRAYDKDGAVFFKVSGKEQVLHDQVYGDVKRTEEKDFPIFRSNGTPVFHFVNVVDDIDMNITHVIRGQDHLTNTNKHLELFEAFGVEAPVFAHIPLILKSVGSGKMSKRDQGALIEEYQEKGFLPEAVRNYLCLLGWNPKNGEEIMPIEKIIELFDFPSIIKSNARFDEKKMAFINTQYIRTLPIEKFAKLARPVLEKAGISITDESYLENVLKISQEKARDVNSLHTLIEYFFTDEFAFDEKAKGKIFKNENAFLRLKEALTGLTDTFSDETKQWNGQNIEAVFENLAEKFEAKKFDYFAPVRYSVSGVSGGPDLLNTLVILGKEKVLSRINKFVKNF